MAKALRNPQSLHWLRGLDLNQRPSGYEPDELPGCSTPRQKWSDNVSQACGRSNTISSMYTQLNLDDAIGQPRVTVSEMESISACPARRRNFLSSKSNAERAAVVLRQIDRAFRQLLHEHRSCRRPSLSSRSVAADFAVDREQLVRAPSKTPSTRLRSTPAPTFWRAWRRLSSSAFRPRGRLATLEVEAVPVEKLIDHVVFKERVQYLFDASSARRDFPSHASASTDRRRSGRSRPRARANRPALRCVLS